VPLCGSGIKADIACVLWQVKLCELQWAVKLCGLEIKGDRPIACDLWQVKLCEPL